MEHCSDYIMLKLQIRCKLLNNCLVLLVCVLVPLGCMYLPTGICLRSITVCVCFETGSWQISRDSTALICGSRLPRPRSIHHLHICSFSSPTPPTVAMVSLFKSLGDNSSSTLLTQQANYVTVTYTDNMTIPTPPIKLADCVPTCLSSCFDLCVCICVNLITPHF